jgi:hypothetical protein
MSIATAAIELLDNDAARLAMCKRAYDYGRQMVWNRVAQSYMSSFARARVDRLQPAHLKFPVQAVESSAANRLLSV